MQSKMREDRLAERHAREVLRPWLLVAPLSSSYAPRTFVLRLLQIRAKQHRAAAEERAAVEAADSQQRSDRLEERLREADNRRHLHLENIKERATLSKV